MDGCIFWTDEAGVRWCKDVNGYYDCAPGSLSYVSLARSSSSLHADAEGADADAGGGEQVWVLYDAETSGAAGLPGSQGEDGRGWGEFTFRARGGGGYQHEDGGGKSGSGGDGALYWRDGEGMWWCRDRYGVYGGGAGAEYYSEDGGSVWFGDGDSWVQVSEEALEFVSVTSARKLRAKALSRSTYSRTYSLAKSHASQGPAGTAGAGAGPVNEQVLQSEDCKGMQPSWENERQVLLQGGAAGGCGAGVGCSGFSTSSRSDPARPVEEAWALSASAAALAEASPSPIWRTKSRRDAVIYGIDGGPQSPSIRHRSGFTPSGCARDSKSWLEKNLLQ